MLKIGNIYYCDYLQSYCILREINISEGRRIYSVQSLKTKEIIVLPDDTGFWEDENCKEWQNSIIDMNKVFEKIRAERDRQTIKWGSLDEHSQSIAGYLLILRKELEEAEAGWMKNKGDGHSALEEVVQIAAVAVACLQQHGFEGN